MNHPVFIGLCLCDRLRRSVVIGVGTWLARSFLSFLRLLSADVTAVITDWSYTLFVQLYSFPVLLHLHWFPFIIQHIFFAVKWLNDDRRIG